MGIQHQPLQTEQPDKHLDMDGAHGHVRHAEGGQDDGLHIAFRELPNSLHTESESDSDSLMDILIFYISISEHSVSVLL